MEGRNLQSPGTGFFKEVRMYVHRTAGAAGMARTGQLQGMTECNVIEGRVARPSKKNPARYSPEDRVNRRTAYTSTGLSEFNAPWSALHSHDKRAGLLRSTPHLNAHRREVVNSGSVGIWKAQQERTHSWVIKLYE